MSEPLPCPGPMAAPAPEPTPGTCMYCGCTEERACPGGCWWIDALETVCSARPCVDRFFAQQRLNLDRIFRAMQEGM